MKEKQDEISKKQKNKFPLTTPLENMIHKHRMDRLKKRLIDQGLYVRPISLNETYQ